MKVFLRLFSIFLISIFFTSCSYLGSKNDRLIDKSASVAARQVENARVYVKATGDSLLHIPSDHKSKALDLAKEFNDKAESVLGRPTLQKPIDVAALLGENAKLRANEAKYVHQLQTADSKAAAELSRLQKELKATQDKLIALGKQKELEDNKNIVKRFWRWAVATFGVAGAVAFMVFAPGIAFPLLTILFKLIISAIPHIIHFLMSLVNSIVDAIKKLWSK